MKVRFVAFELSRVVKYLRHISVLSRTFFYTISQNDPDFIKYDIQHRSVNITKGYFFRTLKYKFYL